MAELFMECEEEELEPWQQKSKPIIVDDDDDDDEPIFVGEILSSKPANAYILNRVHPSSPRVAIQNGTPKRGFQPMARPATSTLAVQPQPREGSVSGTSPSLQKPLPGGSSPQEAAKPSTGISQPVSRSTPTPSLSGNLNIPVMGPSAARPVATVTAQPVALNRAPPTNTSSLVFGIRQSSGAAHCPSGATVTATGLAKRPAPAEVNSVSPKKAKAEETGSGSSSPVLSSVKSPNEMPSLQKGLAACNTKNGAPFPQACPKCNIHFNLLDPLKNHMKYCCPDLVHTFLGGPTPDSSGASAKIAESEKGKLIMLVNDFYYGKYEGNTQQVHQEQKTHTTFKCASCMKLLKNNIRFMNHMKHHLELEKQESWESHTTCQHCYRQFPTPFQLQCHIESTHTPYESSTICRICELSFETEQILLQHMKDNHKPGEMPYVCQVCNYRSSAFSDVEKHFRAVHENTKNLLCPFCLKVVKIGAPYMHHYMRHQKKGVHRCTKCRLQFLTCKEKMDHKSQHHRTFRKPPQLEGLPPGTKVTIRASVGSLPPGSTALPAAVGPSTSTLQLSPNVKTTNVKNYSKLNVSKVKPKLKPLSVQKRQSLATSSGSSGSSNSSSSKKNVKIANTALSSLRCSEIQKCIECSSDIRTFASHFPAYVHCSLCRYGTSCSKAYVNHMMSFHSARQSKRFWIYKARSEELRGITTVCLNCDFVMDDSGLDKMATHLNEHQYHRCQVIAENASLADVTAEDLSDQTNEASFSNEGEDKSQTLARLDPPEGQEEGTSVPACSGTKNSVEGTEKAQLDPGSEPSSADKQEEKAPAPSQEHSSSLALSVPSKDPLEEGKEGCLEGQEFSSSAAAGTEGMASPSALGHSSGLGGQTSSEDPVEMGEAAQTAGQLDEDSVAAERGEGSSPSVSGHSSGPGAPACSEDPGESAEEGSLRKQLVEGPVAAEGGQDASFSNSEHSSGPGRSACSEDPGETAEEGSRRKGLAEGCVAAEGGQDASPSISGHSSGPGVSASLEGPRETAEEECLRKGLAEGPVAAEGGQDVSLPISGHSSGPGAPACSEDHGETAEEGSLRKQLDDGSVAAEGGEGSSPSIPGHSSGPGAPACSEDPAEERRSPLAEGSVAGREGGGDASPSASEQCSSPEASACSEPPRETPEEGSLSSQLAEGAVTSSPCVLERSASPGLAACSKDLLPVSAGDRHAGSCEDQVAESPPVHECEDLRAPAEETENSGDPMEECCAAASCGGDVAPSAPEPSSSPGLLACSKGPSETMDETQGDPPEREVKEAPVAAECLERMAVSLAPAAPLESPAEAVAKDHPGNQTAQCDGNCSAVATGDGGCSPGAQPCLGEALQKKGTGPEASGVADHAGERTSQRSAGDKPCPSPEGQPPGSDVEEAGLEDMDVEPSSLVPDGDVSFEQFLRRRDEPESVSSDMSEQGSVHLEPLTPSEVLEHEATEILQKGGSVASSSKVSGSEQAEAGTSQEDSPSHEEAAASQAEESTETS